MVNMTIANIIDVVNGEYYGPEDLLQEEVTQITTDSREVVEGGLFIALKGDRTDGHYYIPATYEKGALCAISEHVLDHEEEHAYIVVADARTALKELAEFYRKQLSLTVVGITGSVGKTSTKEAIASVLSEKYRVLKTEGNFNNEIGVPLTIFRLTEEDEVAVIEMGISEFGEMHRLSQMVRPDICVITNIGTCHLENLIDRDGVLRAKSEIFDFMNHEGTIILNGDDDKLTTIGSIYGREPDFFGTVDESLDVYGDHIEQLGLYGSRFVLHDALGSCSVEVPVPGEHMVTNALAAAAVGVTMGLTNEEIAEGIRKFTSLPGRNHIIVSDNYTILDDCYNANPMSMRAATEVLCSAKGRKVAILGDMGELGSGEERLHYELGEYVGASQVDLLLCVGTLSKSMKEGFITGRNQKLLDSGLTPQESMEKANACVIHYENIGKLYDELFNLLVKDDAILVKASHFMGFDQIVHLLDQGA
ncbi:MAG: UDP-N-acetylmuramoyl-tripeptide--D-alanyl-D-alanine ligase [Lachnospiraceae bacterium]|nr:UDP-N-acetylmuramoyl-tripeptide--D-alanyl-D-alanine ligase [Lachnospiraceae bacterium]